MLAIVLQIYNLFLIHDNKEKLEKKFVPRCNIFETLVIQRIYSSAYENILISSREYTHQLMRIYSSAHENIRIGQCVYGHRLMHIQVLAYEPMFVGP